MDARENATRRDGNVRTDGRTDKFRVADAEGLGDDRPNERTNERTNERKRVCRTDDVHF